MIAENGEVLYVGKAKNVRKRVASYTRLAGHVNRIARMISATASMIFISVETETDALLLEANLIKQLKPRFNVLMRDDKSFPYILIANDHEAPQIAKHRGSRSRKGDYYGPFASTVAVNTTLTTLQRAFLRLALPVPRRRLNPAATTAPSAPPRPRPGPARTRPGAGPGR